MKMSTRISGGFLVLTVLIIFCGGVGYYGISRLGDSLDYVTGPAWDAADGSMEGSIGVEAQVIALNSIFANIGEKNSLLKEAEEGRAMADSALGRMTASGLLDSKDIQRTDAARTQFRETSANALASFEDFTRSHLRLSENFYAFQALMSLAEELGDGAVEELETNPNQGISWNTGLETKWTAADGSMETQIGMLQRIYFYERLVGFQDEKESLEGLNNANIFFVEAMSRIIKHPLFQNTAISQGKYTGQKYSPVLESLLAQHEQDFDEAIEKFLVYRNDREQYQGAMELILDTLEEIEEIGDSTVEGEVENIAIVVSLVSSMIVGVLLIAVLVAIAMGVLIIGNVRKLLGADPADLAEASEQMALGRLDIRTNDSATGVQASINTTVHKLREVIGGIKFGASQVNVASGEVSQGNIDLSQRTQEQAASLEEIASSMEEMTSTVNQNAENAQQANQLALEAQAQAKTGGEVASKAVTAMEEINTSSRQIADIIGIIDDIAFQTNLLALNAAVEAARAGEQGRGFAVVASEVRNLSGKSASASKEIKALIRDSVNKVEEGSKLVGESGQALEGIVTSVTSVSEMVAEIAAASQEQSMGIGQVSTALVQMDEMTQQNAAIVEEASAASQMLEQQAGKLIQLVEFFTTNDTAQGASREQGVDREAENTKQVAENQQKSESSEIKPGNGNDKAASDADDKGKWSEF